MANAAELMDASISPSVGVAIIVAFIALAGVLIGQAITLYNARAQRRDEQTKAVRTEVQGLMMAFFNFAEFARSTSEPRLEAEAADPYDDEWDRVAGTLAAAAANMGGRGKHRTRALELMDGLGLQAAAWQIGESLGPRPRVGYVQMGWAGFEIVAAWLRGERIPRHARRVAREARRMRLRVEAEYAARHVDDFGRHKPGVVRLALRRVRRGAVSRWRRWVRGPIRKAWAYLFAK